MTRTSLVDRDCPLARASGILGDPWALMIVRDAMEGVTTFSEFRRRSGAAPSVLTSRLERLTAAGVLERIRTGPAVERYCYRLTEKGRDLLPAIVALMQWGERWEFEGSSGVAVLDAGTNRPIPAVRVRRSDGESMELAHLRVRRSVPSRNE